MRPSAMTYDECAASRLCVVEGILSIREMAHVKMGHLLLPNGQCVAVSLPKSEADRLQRVGPKHSVVSGIVYPIIPDEDVVFVEMKGRRIGWGVCGPFYIFAKG
jgi:hypothetical protein